MKTITVRLTPGDLSKLQRGVTANGGINSLIRRMQQNIRVRDGVGWLTISDVDLARIPSYWRNTGGKAGSGGYQRLLPIESLRPYLKTAWEMFSEDASCPVREAVSYCYFKREGVIGDPSRIKIGRGTSRRAATGKSTDNPRLLVTLLRVEEREGFNEKYFHQRFHRLRIDPSQEWFWPGEDLMEFIHEQFHAQLRSQSLL